MKKDGKKKRMFLLGVLLILQVVIYAPNVGTGFVTDDFIWLGNSVTAGEVDIFKPFTVTTDFYRPLTGVGFGLQYALHGMNPWPYGAFNLLLHLGNILLVYLLLSTWPVSRPFAVAGAALFAFNAKAVPMAVGWISGRTTLMFSFFVLLSLLLYLKAVAALPRHQALTPPPSTRWFKPGFLFPLSGLSYLAALLCKETAAAVPLFVFAFTFFIRTSGPEYANPDDTFKRFHTALRATLVFIPPLAIYAVLRFSANAITPFDAPAYYRYTFSPEVIFKNLWEYISRAAMPDILIAVLLALLIMSVKEKRKPGATINGKLMAAGGIWFFAFLLPTLYLPVRSDLYIYLPQVGLHMIFMAAAAHWWKARGMSIEGLKNRGTITAILTVVMLFTVMWLGYLYLRANAYSESGQCSEHFIQRLRESATGVPPGSRVLLIDEKAKEKHSPTHIVAYGFDSLLRLYYPDKGLWGEIAASTSHVKWYHVEGLETVLFYSNKNNRLNGPFYYSDVQTIIESAHFPVSPKVEPKKEETIKAPPVRRPGRLKKRKKRLKEMKTIQH
ncbi:MAG: hypothetical protein GY940_20495 [bacterium]|nr:hypothetical protein [bacterium]